MERAFSKNNWQYPINEGTHTTEFQSVQVMNVQDSRATVWIIPGGFPNVKGAESERLFDISNLEQIHR